nr:MAG TPA: hypothetical protein [Caudoviricetes sp.]
MYVLQYMQVATLVYYHHQSLHMRILRQQQGKQLIYIEQFQLQDVLIADV